MVRVLIAILCAALLASCAAQTAMSPTDRAIAEGYLVPSCQKPVLGEKWSCPPPPPFRPSMNLGQAVTDLATIPLRLPDAMISNYPPGGKLYCRSNIHKDQFRTSCY